MAHGQGSPLLDWQGAGIIVCASPIALANAPVVQTLLCTSMQMAWGKRAQGNLAQAAALETRCGHVDARIVGEGESPPHGSQGKPAVWIALVRVARNARPILPHATQPRPTKQANLPALTPVCSECRSVPRLEARPKRAPSAPGARLQRTDHRK